MGAFGTFLLVAAFIGTLMVVFSPANRLRRLTEGKTNSEIEKAMKEAFEQYPAQFIGKSLALALLLIGAILYTFVIEPFVVITALVDKIGYQPLAYGMLVVICLLWVRSVRGFALGGKKATTIITPDGEKVTGIVDEKIKAAHPVWSVFWRIFGALPIAYLWYLFLVVIGLPI